MFLVTRDLSVRSAVISLSLSMRRFFTVLIFADVVIVLASLGSTRTHSVIFRNFAFAAVTVFLRLALSAGPYTNSILGVGAALFAVIAVWISNSAVAPAAAAAREKIEL